MGLKPSWYLSVFFISLITHFGRTSSNQNLDDINSGTVLFEKIDYSKHCWSAEELVILNSRRMFQDILPKMNIISYQNDYYITPLMDYFYVCLENVRKLTVGKTRHLMLKALADAMGGYLRLRVLPVTRLSYYAGNVKYRSARRLFELYDELRKFLRTNGAGWSKPNDTLKHANDVPSIVIEPLAGNVESACDALITYPAHHGNSRLRRHARKQKGKRKRHRKSRSSDGKENPVIIPIPFLDNEIEPNSVALPLKGNTLHSLFCEKSAYAVEKFYTASARCIMSRSHSNFELKNFNEKFLDWLQHSVSHHLNGEKWYPAFGGILRIVTFLKNSSIKPKSFGTLKYIEKLNLTLRCLINRKFLNKGARVHKGENDKAIYTTPHAVSIPTKQPIHASKYMKEKNSAFSFGTIELVIIVGVSLLIIWILIGLCIVCYRWCKADEQCDCSSYDHPPYVILYGNKNFCHTEESPMLSPRRGCIRRVKEWWKSKFRCPGGCQDQYAEEERCLATVSYSRTGSSGRRYSK